MTRIRLDDLKAALETKRQPAKKSEADYKRELVDEINRIGGRASRFEDRYAVGKLDLGIKYKDLPFVWAEAKLIDGNLFQPTPSQYHEGRKWQSVGIECVLIGWKDGQMFCSPWVEKADCRECFTMDVSYGQALWEYLK